MVYKILCAADFHWGAMDPDKQYEENKFITDYIKENDILKRLDDFILIMKL